MKNLMWLCLVPLLLSESASAAEFKSTGVPRYDSAIKAAVSYLNQNADNVVGRENSLIAYALVKAGTPAASPLVQAGIEAAIERTEKGHGTEGYDHIYLAGVDAMLLADTDPEGHLGHLQKIADYVQSAQRADGSWAGNDGPGDTSMNQYGMLALWAANRAGCNITPLAVDRAAQWHLKNGNGDGGWGYRPPSSQGSGGGASTHNCTMAGAGSLGIARMLLFGPKTKPKVETEKVEAPKFGVLERVVPDEDANKPASAFANYNASVSASAIDSRVTRAFQWTTSKFEPEGHRMNQKQYFFYALERAAALYELQQVQGKDWYTAYADVLLTLQSANGAFEKTNTSPRIGASFAILYLTRSTQQIINKQFGKGIMIGSRDLANLYGEKKKEKKELGPLDELLATMADADLSGLENVDSEAVVEKILISDRNELIGQLDMLKRLLENKDPENRRMAYWALGRTGDFSLVPMMLQGLRDPNVDCNIEALRSLRYIARKPNGFGLSLQPLAGAETADEERKVEVVNAWRTKAYNTWGDWYRKVRPFDEGGGLDELELMSQGRRR